MGSVSESTGRLVNIRDDVVASHIRSSCTRPRQVGVHDSVSTVTDRQARETIEWALNQPLRCPRITDGEARGSRLSETDCHELAVRSPVPDAVDQRRRREDRRVQLVDANQPERAAGLHDECLAEIVGEEDLVGDGDRRR